MIFNDEYIYLNVSIQKNSKMFLEGYIKNPSQYNKMVVLAPNPIDRMINYSGSGLPFPNEHIAFENTKNMLMISGTGIINAVFSYPNSFYSRNGKNKILPSIFIELAQGNNAPFQLQYELRDLNTLRSLINRESRQGPEFYGAKDVILPIDTAENVMYAYAQAKLTNDIG
jgi:hypothetical protein